MKRGGGWGERREEKEIRKEGKERGEEKWEKDRKSWTGKGEEVEGKGVGEGRSNDQSYTSRIYSRFVISFYTGRLNLFFHTTIL